MPKGLFDDVDDDSFEGDELFGSAKRDSSDLFGNFGSSMSSSSTMSTSASASATASTSRSGGVDGLFESSGVSATSLVAAAPLFSSAATNRVSAKRQATQISSNLFGDDDDDELNDADSLVIVPKPSDAATAEAQTNDGGDDTTPSGAWNQATESNAKAVEAFGQEWAYSSNQNLSEGRRASFGVRDATEVLADFSKWFGSSGKTKETLISSAISGDLRNSKIRSIAWRVFMDILPPLEKSSLGDWQSTILAKREEYMALMKKYKTDPTNMSHVDPLLNNPLATSDESPWTAFYAEQELIEEIKKDLERLYPTGCDEFFESSHMQARMLNVLFLWCRMHPDTSYRQGMHELLAPIVWLMEHEKLICNMAVESEAHKVLSTILDGTEIEADSFWLFERMMKDLEPLFEVNKGGRGGRRNVPLTNDLGSDSAKDIAEAALANEALSPILKMCTRIQHKFLREADPDLHEHLVGNEIEPQLYGLRWGRLMFGREFHIEDVLILWDGIFASLPQEGNLISEIEYVSTAMLLYVREALLVGDYMACLRRINRFPPVEDVSVFIDRVQQLKKNPGIVIFKSKKVHAPKVEANPTQSAGMLPQYIASAKSGVSSLTAKIPAIPASIGAMAQHYQGGVSAAGLAARAKSKAAASSSSRTNSRHASPALSVGQKLRDQQALAMRMGKRLEHIALLLQNQLLTPAAEETQDNNIGENSGATGAHGSNKEQEDNDETPDADAQPHKDASPQNFDETVIFQAIAELKQVKDVLLMRLSEQDVAWEQNVEEYVITSAVKKCVDNGD